MKGEVEKSGPAVREAPEDPAPRPARFSRVSVNLFIFAVTDLTSLFPSSALRLCILSSLPEFELACLLITGDVCPKDFPGQSAPAHSDFLPLLPSLFFPSMFIRHLFMC